MTVNWKYKVLFNRLLVIVFFGLQSLLSFAKPPIDLPECLTVTIFQDQIKYACPQQNNGKLNIKIAGGVKPYFVFWEDERGNIGGPLTVMDSLAEIPNLAPLRYTFEVFDSGIGLDRCFSGLQGPIDMIEADFEVDAGLVTLPKCHGEANGALKAAVHLNGRDIAELDAYRFIWQNEALDTVSMQSQASNLSAGNYQLIALTNNNCRAISSIVLPQPDPLQIMERQVTPAFCSTSDNGEIQINSIIGGTGEASVIWEDAPNVTATTLSNLKPATYHFVVQDENACMLADSAIITSQMNLEVALVSAQSQLTTSCHNTADASLTVTIRDNISSNIFTQIQQPYQFDWSSNAPISEDDFASSRLTDLESDTFEVRVSNPDLPGCLATLDIPITSPLLLKIDSAALNYGSPNCIDPFSGTATLEALGGTPNYLFQWSDGENGAERTNLAATNYSVTISDQNDCTIQHDFTISEPDSLKIAISNQQEESCLGTNDGAISIRANQPATNLTYFWEPQVSHDSFALQLGNGLYRVEAEDENGCSDTMSIVISSIINQVNQPILQNDKFEFDFFANKQLNVLANDDFQDQAIHFNLIDNPNPSVISVDPQNNIHIASTNFFFDQIDFSYEVCLVNCPVICSTARIEVELEGQNFFPSGFTPNGDGINDELVFLQLTDDRAANWPNNELIVFNRWGSIVYQSKPYLNNWDGTNYKNGKPLPAGTYFYLLRLDIGNGKVKQRELTILR